MPTQIRPPKPQPSCICKSNNQNCTMERTPAEQKMSPIVILGLSQATSGGEKDKSFDKGVRVLVFFLAMAFGIGFLAGMLL